MNTSNSNSQQVVWIIFFLSLLILTGCHPNRLSTRPTNQPATPEATRPQGKIVDADQLAKLQDRLVVHLKESNLFGHMGPESYVRKPEDLYALQARVLEISLRECGLTDTISDSNFELLLFALYKQNQWDTQNLQYPALVELAERIAR